MLHLLVKFSALWMHNIHDYLLHVCSVSLGVGYYGNQEAEKGLDSTLEAVASITETVGRIHNLVIWYLHVLHVDWK